MKYFRPGGLTPLRAPASEPINSCSPLMEWDGEDLAPVPVQASRNYFKNARQGLAPLALIVSLLIHIGIIYPIFFGLPAWLKLFPSCLASCLSCSEPCRNDDRLPARMKGLPQCLANCFSYSQSQRQPIQFRPDQVIKVEIIETPPSRPEAAAPPANEVPPNLYELKGNSRYANDESGGLAPSSGPEGRELTSLAPAPENPLKPPPDKEAISLEKKSPPPPVEVPKVKEADRPNKPQNKNNQTDQGIMPLHEIITRSLGRDAAGRMLGSSGGNEVDPAMRNYLSNTLARLNRNWRDSAQRTRGFQASYEMTIEPSGRIAGFRLIKSNGSADFNRSVEAAIRKSSPLPPLPSSYGRGALRVVFTFSNSRR